MKILAVDSSSKTASACLLEDGAIRAESSVLTDTHSAVLLPMIGDMLRAAKTSVGGLDLLAVTVGPGSFTGVRIGVSTVKGLAFADRIPCAGVSTLEAMAYGFAGIPGLVAPVIDARRGTVFTALFRSDEKGGCARLTADEQLPLDALMERLADYPEERIYFTGDAYPQAHAHPRCPENAAFTPEKLRMSSAYGAGVRAYELFTAPDADPAQFTDAALVPAYLKKSQAEREREERLAAERKTEG